MAVLPRYFSASAGTGQRDGSRKNPIVLFGTPGVAVEALHLPIARRLTFIGENNSVTQRLRALNDAAEQSLTLQFCTMAYPQMGAGAVIVDPPWYMDFVKPMLAIAAHTVCVGGFVFVSVPPEGVRSSAIDDQAKLIRRAGRLGLRLHSVQPLALHYETPFFEQNALAAAGIGCSQRWRRGDLLVFEKSASRLPILTYLWRANANGVSSPSAVCDFSCDARGSPLALPPLAH